MKKLLSVLLPLMLAGLLPLPASAQLADVLNDAVTQATIEKTICREGYLKSIQPPAAYMDGVKKNMLAMRGMDAVRQGSAYAVVHIVPLALGGHPRNPENLMLQPLEGPLGVQKKQKLDLRLSRMVCARQITLVDARLCIRKDWQACALKY
jgi:hypothetical protein